MGSELRVTGLLISVVSRHLWSLHGLETACRVWRIASLEGRRVILLSVSDLDCVMVLSDRD